MGCVNTGRRIAEGFNAPSDLLSPVTNIADAVNNENDVGHISSYLEQAKVIRNDVAAGKSSRVLSERVDENAAALLARLRLIHANDVFMTGERDIEIDKIAASNQVDIVAGRDEVVDGTEKLNGSRRVERMPEFSESDPLEAELSDKPGPLAYVEDGELVTGEEANEFSEDQANVHGNGPRDIEVV